MTSYVDVETSPEALQEDEELIEAVNVLVGTVSGKVKTEIENEVNGLILEVRSFIETRFPLIKTYQEDPSRLRLDLQHCCVFVCILLFAVWFLGPRRPGATALMKRQNSSLLNNNNNEEEDHSDSVELTELQQSDEERFEKLYESHIQCSEYRKLVLPPSCKLVNNTPIVLRSTKAAKVSPSTRLKSTKQEDDDPAARLWYYLRQLGVFMQSILSYDYAAAGRTLILWLQGIQHLRQSRVRRGLDDTSNSRTDDFATDPAGAGPAENDDEGEPLTIEPAKTPLHEEWRGMLTPATSKNSRQQSDLSTYTDTTGRRPSADDTELQRDPVLSMDEAEITPKKYHNSYFDAPSSQDSLTKLHVTVAVPDKNGYVLDDEFIPDTCTPLLVFVNSRSGPQQGHLLITQLRRLLNPIQVWDLADGPPGPVLSSFLKLTRLRILVCGGDGTVAWIIQTLEDMKITRQWPPIAILPLGTGNDLARIHGWGGGYNNESLIGILEQISESYISLLDRWEVTIDEKKKKGVKKGFFNYLGVGADAQAALHVHNLRESKPEWFFSRMMNKAFYGVFGAEDIIKANNANVRKEIKLVADGVHIPLPPDTGGIIILNIDAYAGGVPLWSHGTPPPDLSRPNSLSDVPNGWHREPIDRVESVDDLSRLTTEEAFARVTACDRPPSCQDGYLDIISIRGAFHLGQIKVGLSNAQRLCQCREATITIKHNVAVQVDGEPWRQKSSRLRIRRKKDPAVMLHRSVDDGGVETEMSKLLDWAVERKMIDRNVHGVLMKEFSRRIESKNRQRRVRANNVNGVMSTLKKAISSGAMANLSSQSSTWHTSMGGGIAF